MTTSNYLLNLLAAIFDSNLFLLAPLVWALPLDLSPAPEVAAYMAPQGRQGNGK